MYDEQVIEIFGVWAISVIPATPGLQSEGWAKIPEKHSPVELTVMTEVVHHPCCPMRIAEG